MSNSKLLSMLSLSLTLFAFSWGNGEAAPDPGGIPHYYGPYPNYANSPLPSGGIATIVVDAPGSGYSAPTAVITDTYGVGAGATADVTLDALGGIAGFTITNPGSGYIAPIVSITDATGTGAAASVTIGGALTGGLRKFVDALPSLIVAIPDTTTYPGSDYYEIELGQYTQKMHSDLPPTTLRGYRQVNTGGPASQFSYLGPAIVAQRDRPVRIKFINALPTGTGGNLVIPVDTTVMGAGMGPVAGEMYTQNRATVHLHGNNSVWISDGTPHQWITPAGESTAYPKGVSVVNVPDMPESDGSMTFYYTNAQSARLMFYHDHSFGITRLNVYAGEAAAYLLTDQVEQDLINGTNVSGVNPGSLRVLPDAGIPLVIQDRTFVDAATIGYQDPTWNWGTGPRDPNTGNITSSITGDLWYPHVYMPNQNPWDPSGMNAYGRWHYGPWFWPPSTNLAHPPVANEYYDPVNAPWEPPLRPDTPNPSTPGEAFMDTPIVNGMAYPALNVEPKVYRFRILNAANDRFFNLQLYKADPAVVTADGRVNTEVKMAPAIATAGFPPDWPTDGRAGGVPDATTAGPSFIQIGTEGGFLPKPVVLPNQPVDWNMDPTNFDMGNVNKGTLILGTAERADVLVDFSAFAGQTLILYNDAPAAFPAMDARYDYYTGNPDLTSIGGTPTTQPGYGPNTRTIMQINVGTTVTTPTPDATLANLESVWAKGTGASTKRGVFEVSQDQIIVPTDAYNSAYGKTGIGADTFAADAYARIFDTSLTFSTLQGGTATIGLEPKAIQDEMGEAFDLEFGRMSAMLGLELPNTMAGAQNFVLYGYASPPVEIVKNTIFGTPIGGLGDGTQIWKITHNGVDTHTLHTHLFNVQIINRVAWDNARRLPDPNELGWKETFRVNPLQDTIVALRPVAPSYAPAGTGGNTIPFQVPNSVRLIDPTMPEGEPLNAPLGGFKDPNGNPVTLLNKFVNFGWEYVDHCHLLAHEEMDMMHSVAFAVAPIAPSNLTAAATNSGAGTSVALNWTDNSVNETGFTIQRSTSSNFSTALANYNVGANVNTFTNTISNTTGANQTYYYRVFASNVVGDTGDYTGTNQPSFPTATMNSASSNAVSAIALAAAAAPSNLTATASAPGPNLPRVTLNWADNSNNETGFSIQRATDTGFTTGVATFAVGANVTSYTDTSVAVTTTYYYRVQALSAAGPSAFSNTATATTPGLTPLAPASLRASSIGTNYVILAWTDTSNNEQGFYIERSSNNGATWTRVGQTAANSTLFRNLGLTSRTTYQYRVQAFNAAGVSTYSNTLTVTTP